MRLLSTCIFAGCLFMTACNDSKSKPSSPPPMLPPSPPGNSVQVPKEQSPPIAPVVTNPSPMQPPKQRYLEPGPVDYKVDAATFSKESTNQQEFGKKYVGKRVEISGEISHVQTSHRGVIALTFGDPSKNPIYFSIQENETAPDKFAGYATLAVGQKLTFQGRLSEPVAVFVGVVVTEVGPSTAQVATVASLLADLKGGPKKFDGKTVVVRAVVQEVNVRDEYMMLTIADLNTKEPTIVAHIDMNRPERAEKAPKPSIGSTIIVMGEGDTLNDGRIWGARIVPNPPAGITLP